MEGASGVCGKGRVSETAHVLPSLSAPREGNTSPLNSPGKRGVHGVASGGGGFGDGVEEGGDGGSERGPGVLGSPVCAGAWAPAPHGPRGRVRSGLGLSGTSTAPGGSLFVLRSSDRWSEGLRGLEKPTWVALQGEGTVATGNGRDVDDFQAPKKEVPAPTPRVIDGDGSRTQSV